ncbi:unnamed protein product [Peronospora farinosa]|uniref:Endonuclease/exonuclease/phosphatase domain-containing protein n=1 Tax=Peronospora farinosa TaxID=134698 RepID=A0AAV0SU56_9STRA|nr:unnamed protein product [Peronospora farinosa]
MNINGPNAPGRSGGAVRSMFDKLLSAYDLIAFQETKFSKPDHIRVVTHYIKSSDATARAFWSHRDDADFTIRNGVALILSSTHPFTSVTDVTTLYAHAD